MLPLYTADPFGVLNAAADPVPSSVPKPWLPARELITSEVALVMALELIVNVTVPEEPAALVTLTNLAPADAFSWSTALISVLLLTVKDRTIPALVLTDVAPVNWFPVIVTGTIAPWVPEFGATDVTVALSFTIVNPTVPL